MHRGLDQSMGTGWPSGDRSVPTMTSSDPTSMIRFGRPVSVAVQSAGTYDHRMAASAGSAGPSRAMRESPSALLGRRFLVRYWIAVAGTNERPIDNHWWEQQARWDG